MELSDVVALLNGDLKNEWKHFKFYLHHASAITGLHAHEYKEFLLEQAASEMKHVSQFSDMLVGLGTVPTTDNAEFPFLTTARSILEYALDMEIEVVENYTKRIAQLDEVRNSPETSAHKKWIEIFLEKQIEDSRQDLDHIRQILKGV
jgi:bacterioferritin (cytochrome b1)